MDDESFREILEEKVGEYNKYRSPEATARLISIYEKSFKIEFTGAFCYTCGFYDWFEDYKILLEEIGLKTEITGVEEFDEGALVKFEIVE